MKRHYINNKVAIVTGAGKRLGRQIAIGLAKNGFVVVVNFFHSKSGASKTCSLISDIGGEAFPYRADVTNRQQVLAMVKKVYSSYGTIDLLVNNSAIFVEQKFTSISEKIWDTTLDINLKSVFLCSQTVAPYMLKRSHGRIINIASVGGIQAWQNHIPYSVSKAGVIMLTKCMAKALSPHVMVNTIAPGTIIIPGEEDPKQKHIQISRIPLQRYGQPDDITAAVNFLATTSSYMTGQILAIDGGRSI